MDAGKEKKSGQRNREYEVLYFLGQSYFSGHLKNCGNELCYLRVSVPGRF